MNWTCGHPAKPGEGAMTVTVEFHFDFGSPNAYLAHRVIPDIERRTGASFRYVPVLLGGVFKATGNRSPGEAFAGIRNKLEYEPLETERFRRRHAITEFNRNPFFPVNTLRIMRGAVAADLDGALASYVAAVFHHMVTINRAVAIAETQSAESGLALLDTVAGDNRIAEYQP
jgi:2-hydroxychromene-2-carboxylate isomerase